VTTATLVVKRGASGCSVLEGSVPAEIDQAPTYRGTRVEVLNVLGAGDAFIAGFLYGWLRDEGIERSCTYANACGAIVVSRHGCAPAMPSRAELDYFLAHSENLQRPDRDEELAHLHRVSVARPAGTICISSPSTIAASSTIWYVNVTLRNRACRGSSNCWSTPSRRQSAN
jgi:5-dehydro-2-deoxygluconokinase